MEITALISWKMAGVKAQGKIHHDDGHGIGESPLEDMLLTPQQQHLDLLLISLGEYFHKNSIPPLTGLREAAHQRTVREPSPLSHFLLAGGHALLPKHVFLFILHGLFRFFIFLVDICHDEILSAGKHP